MAERGGQPGNQNAAKAKRWAAAIDAAIARRVSDGRLRGLEDLADKLIDAVIAGDLAAAKELGDRIDGKPAQAIVGDPDQPLTHRIERVIIDGTSVRDA